MRTAILVLSALCAAAPASADDPTARGFDPDPARLALSQDGGFAVETAAPALPGAYSGAVVLDYARDLLVLRLGDTRDALLESRLSAHLLGAYAFRRFELAVDLPIAMRQESDFSLLTRQGVTGPLVAPVSGTALGDLRVGVKVPVLRSPAAPVQVAALLDLRAPTGNGDAFTGDGAMAVPSVVATRALGPVRLDAQVGYALRGRGQYAQLVVHDGLVYGVGAGVELPGAGPVKRWRALAELVGGWPRGTDLDGARYRAPLSARAGVRAFLPSGLALELGGGAGLGEAGYGREAWRVFLGVRFAGERVGPGDEDADKDGVPNGVDACPRDAGTPELDGCPDEDGDTIPDREDDCPHEAGPPQNDGCPVAEAEPLVEIETERLSLKDAIQFDTGRDTIRQQSFRVLDQIAALLLQRTELERVRVEGHTDNVGAAAYNKDLSQRRAQSVVRYLVSKGVVAGRLVARGYGFERPVASNGTALGRAKNRRVEFTLLGGDEDPDR